jgi:hypothetical protein
MRDEPGIQVADLLGWLANRYNTHGSSDRWGSWFSATFLAKDHHHRHINKESIMSLFDLDGKMKDGIQLPPSRIETPRIRSVP